MAASSSGLVTAILIRRRYLAHDLNSGLLLLFLLVIGVTVTVFVAVTVAMIVTLIVVLVTMIVLVAVLSSMATAASSVFFSGIHDVCFFLIR